MRILRAVTCNLLLVAIAAALPTYSEHAMDVLSTSQLPTSVVGRNATFPFGPIGVGPGKSSAFVGAGSSVSDLDRWHRVLRAAASGELLNMTVLVLGGSLEAGRMKYIGDDTNEPPSGCKVIGQAEGKQSTGRGTMRCTGVNTDCRPCAFPARLEVWLRSAYPNLHVRVLNWAVGGSTSRSVLGTIAGELESDTHGVDVAIVNYVSNDAAHFVPAIARGFEALVRLLLGLHGGSGRRLPTAVLVTQMLVPRGMPVWLPHAHVTTALSVPMLSFLQAAPGLQLGNRHPGWETHQLIADWLAAEWREQAATAGARAAASGARAGGAPPLPPPLSRATASDVVCAAPETLLDANNKRKAEHYAAACKSTTWRFAEDVPGKRGWLIDAPAGGRLRLEVRVPRAGAVIGIGFLASYSADMGSVRVALEGGDAVGVRLDARRDGSGVSLTEYVRLCAPRGNATADFPLCEAPVAQAFKYGRGAPDSAPCDESSPQCALARAQAQSSQAETRTLVFDLIPRPGAEHNRFVIRYVVTC